MALRGGERGWSHPPVIFGTTGSVTIIFSPDVKFTDQIQESHANFMKLTNIVSIDVKKMYLKISDQYLKNWLFYRLILNGLWYQLFLTPYWHQCVCVCVLGGGVALRSHPLLRSRKLMDAWPWNFYQVSSTMGRQKIQKLFWHYS